MEALRSTFISLPSSFLLLTSLVRGRVACEARFYAALRTYFLAITALENAECPPNPAGATPILTDSHAQLLSTPWCRDTRLHHRGDLPRRLDRPYTIRSRTFPKPAGRDRDRISRAPRQRPLWLWHRQTPESAGPTRMDSRRNQRHLSHPHHADGGTAQDHWTDHRLRLVVHQPVRFHSHPPGISRRRNPAHRHALGNFADRVHGRHNPGEQDPASSARTDPAIRRIAFHVGPPQPKRTTAPDHHRLRRPLFPRASRREVLSGGPGPGKRTTHELRRPIHRLI